MAEFYRYAAFISYSSKDARFAQRLHRALESYGIPSSLGKFDLIGGGGKQNRIYPVFRDREELSAGHLGDQIEANLKASATLIVVCSPNGAASPWVQKEIEFFAAQGRHAKIFAIIADTVPLTDEQGADCTQSCFPPAFRGDALNGDKLEPLAADARKGKDGFRMAWLKIVAGMIGVTPGQIIDRDRARRRQQRAQVALAAFGLAAFTGYAAALVNAQRWRTAILTYSNSAVARGESIEPTALAIASARRRDYILPAAAPDIGAVLPALGSMNIVSSISGVTRDHVQMSADGKKLVTRARDGVWRLYNFSENDIPRDLGRARYVTLARSGAAAVIQESDGTGTVRDLVHGAPPRSFGHLGVEIPYRSSLSDDGTIFVMQTDSGRTEVFDLTASEPPIDLGIIDTFDLSANGRTLITRDRDNVLAVMNPRERGRSLNAGVAHRFVVSENGEVLVVERPGGAGLRFNLLTGAMPSSLGTIGPLWNLEDTLRGEDLQLSADGRVLAVQRRAGRVADELTPGNVTAYNLSDTAATPWLLGQMQSFTLYANGATIVGSGDDNERIYDTQRRAIVLDFVGIGRVQTAPRGSVVLAIGADYEAQLHDLGASRAPRNLGQVTSAQFSQDGDALLVVRPDNSVLLYNTANNAVPLPVTDIARRYSRFILSQNGAALLAIVGAEGERGVVYSTRGRFRGDASTNSFARANAAHAVCRANSNTMFPFSATVRATISSGADIVLVGRPWNPCDWRGLLAILPNAKAGDGWFEGGHQWLRRVHVRYFGAKDYACEETTSRASAETRARRREMCLRVAAARPA